jgi:hypothetical protein
MEIKNKGNAAEIKEVSEKKKKDKMVKKSKTKLIGGK